MRSRHPSLSCCHTLVPPVNHTRVNATTGLRRRLEGVSPVDVVNDLFAAKAKHFTAQYGVFDLYVTANAPRVGVSSELLVLVRGDVAQSGVLCRVSSACITSTALGSIECECALQLDAALARIDAVDQGVLIYLTDQEGRGQGLTTKVRALANKNQGFDTFEAVEELGLDADVRSYEAVPAILDALGVRSIQLLTGNPDKQHALARAGVSVDGIESLAVEPNTWARRSLQAKQARGHTVVGRYVDDPLERYP